MLFKRRKLFAKKSRWLFVAKARSEDEYRKKCEILEKSGIDYRVWIYEDDFNLANRGIDLSGLDQNAPDEKGVGENKAKKQEGSQNARFALAEEICKSGVYGQNALVDTICKKNASGENAVGAKASDAKAASDTKKRCKLRNYNFFVKRIHYKKACWKIGGDYNYLYWIGVS